VPRGSPSVSLSLTHSLTVCRRQMIPMILKTRKIERESVLAFVFKCVTVCV